ncbi:GNAT family N-acetyltransferase [Anaerospora hongkongensis]|uniref:GNAT family N-acetyltransferase n=1 Tax=Anaerospora hongkongensis TaxID=244830 RepID=UPI0028A072E1|nr:GNAT family N-acetyltransferase [Anaerospora hongkongensis]
MIEEIGTVEDAVISRLVEMDREAFGSGGMNEWHLVPLIRHGRVFAIRREGEIVGAIQYMLDWDEPYKAYLVGVSVCRHWQGKGVGTQLLTESFRRLIRYGLKEVELTVAPENTRAVKLYETKFGFVTTGFRKAEYGEGEDRLVMKCRLPA